MAMASTSIDTGWLRVLRASARPKLRLFCFPYAGAGPSVYKAWGDALPASVELVGVHYPGREARAGEAAHTDFGQLVHQLRGAIMPHLDQPFAFFGHSMGAYVSFALTRALHELHGMQPEHLFLSGAGAPHVPEANPIHALPSRQFLTEVIRLNGIPKEVLASPEMLSYLLPVLRADFTACENFSDARTGSLRCPLTVFGGTRDPRVSRAKIEGWRDYADSAISISISMVEGDHFFLHEQKSLVLGNIVRQLGTYTS
jgi:medium-chain acyl-[acyl-carrier-protein] hydrolase